MKKLLSLLSILTISGTAVPTTISASSYQKEENINNEINYQQINNFEKLNRNKRQNSENNIYRSQKIVIKTNGTIYNSGVVLNNKLYFGSQDHNVYEYNPATGQQKIVIKTNGEVWSSGLVLNNKVYFGSDDHNVYEYDLVTKTQKIVMTANHWIRSSGRVLNNKVYFGSDDHNVYEYNPATGQQKIVIKTNGHVDSSGVILNNKLYVGSWDHNVYEYSKYDLNLNLGEINDNSNDVILNELNYLNPDLDILELEVINKTNNSANVKIKNNLNNDINTINIKYSINNEQNKIINLNELIKKAIFFKFRDENNNLKFKEIKNININNLNYSNVEITRKEKPSSKLIAIKDVCFNREFINKTLNVKSFNIPACEYNSKIKSIFQIKKGLSKNEIENINNTGWILNNDEENKLMDLININNINKITHNFSNDFNFLNFNKQEQEMILNVFKESENKFELNPNEKLEINYSVRITKFEVILNLKQEIMGTINAKIIDENNQEHIITLSIKKAMQILQNYSILPNEITIDKNNDGIIFNGEALFSLEREGQVKSNINTFIV